MRASTRSCSRVWGSGLNSPLETIWVGTGDAKAAVSAGAVRCSSSWLRKCGITSLLLGAGLEQWFPQHMRAVRARRETSHHLLVVGSSGILPDERWLRVTRQDRSVNPKDRRRLIPSGGVEHPVSSRVPAKWVTVRSFSRGPYRTVADVGADHRAFG